MKGVFLGFVGGQVYAYRLCFTLFYGSKNAQKTIPFYPTFIRPIRRLPFNLNSNRTIHLDTKNSFY